MWPFSSSYPIKALEEVTQRTYDYIVVGGGTAGTALAARLSEDGAATVLLLERGPFSNSLISRVPIASTANGSYTVRRECVTAVETGNRKVDILTAETLGGNTRINGMIYTRGAPKVEATVALRQTESLESGIYKALEESAALMGLPIVKDGNHPDASAMGYFNLDLTIDKSGYRHSGFHAYLPENVVCQRPSLDICPSAVIVRVDVAEDESTVRGVYVQSAVPSVRTTPSFIKARREVVLSAGAICTPQILQLSGIGSRAVLENLGITVRKDLPDVGRHLADHYLFPVFIQVPMHDSLQQLLANPLQAIRHVLLFATAGKGWLKSAVDRAIYLNTRHIDGVTGMVQANEKTLNPRNKDNLPDVEIMVVPMGTKPDIYPGEPLFTLQVCLNHAKTEGSVDIRSSDPLDDPEINLNMLKHPDDIQTAREALRFTLRLVEKFCFDSSYEHSSRPFVGPGHRQWSKGDCLLASDEELDEYIRKYISPVWHLTSTSRMGKAGEGVVDDELRVHGFKNLRIADASVLPITVSSHSMAPVYMVA
ncbi:hypothetical protein B0I35DRAFT_474033 [Stachybotrys elegans]|uniref:Glucose-methanol-choline oxidoreductase N-terminal domain-containing protein n=1 Tax=Stachybotrys elegans TaxID=80388 RepID=A0A8K0WX78_9HYPO|nr:hypothetical protein B0I35DRAFT_474033 [Stachybotrys elegans]